MAVTGTWASVQDALDYTGKSVTTTNLNVAQTMIEGLIKRVYRASDVNTSAYYWLSRAVAWQAAYVAEHGETISMANNVQSMAQDGFSVTYSNSEDVNNVYSPVALRCLDNLYRGANTTIRFNSAFQRRRLGVRWRAI